MEESRPAAPERPARREALAASFLSSLSHEARRVKARAWSALVGTRHRKDLRPAVRPGLEIVRRRTWAAADLEGERSGSKASFSRPWPARARPSEPVAWAKASSRAPARLVAGSWTPVGWLVEAQQGVLTAPWRRQAVSRTAAVLRIMRQTS
jgi:hypothetical protein